MGKVDFAAGQAVHICSLRNGCEDGDEDRDNDILKYGEPFFLMEGVGVSNVNLEKRCAISHDSYSPCTILIHPVVDLWLCGSEVLPKRQRKHLEIGCSVKQTRREGGRSILANMLRRARAMVLGI